MYFWIVASDEVLLCLKAVKLKRDYFTEVYYTFE